MPTHFPRSIKIPPALYWHVNYQVAKVPVVILNIVSKEETDEGEGVKEPGSVHMSTVHRGVWLFENDQNFTTICDGTRRATRQY